MKLLIYFFALLVLALGAPGLAPFLLGAFLFGALYLRRTASLCVTLTVSEILTDVLQAFKKRVPALKFFAADMSADRVKFGQPIIAHIPSLPVAYDHVAANGYSANAQKARDLLTDVSITIDGWKDVPIKINADDASQDRSQNYLKTINNAGYVLGKAVVDYALTKILAANFTNSTQESIANTTKDTLGLVRLGMNGVGAGTPRFMLCNSPFANALDSDVRIINSQFYNQRTEADPYLHLTGIAGFSEILEYPDFPANAESLSAFGFDSRAIAIATRLPLDSTDIARQLGVPITYSAEMVQDPESGLAIVGFSWIDPDTHIIFITFSVMFGAVAGAQGGAAGVKTDYAGWRVKTG